MTDTPSYAELHCHSYFSLLDGASSPESLIKRAQEVNLQALALTDHNSLAGAVRFQTAAKRAGLPAIFGAEVTLEDGAHLTLLAETQTGYRNLCKLITTSRLAHISPDEHALWVGKIDAALTWEALATSNTGLICLSGCRRGPLASAILGNDFDQARTKARGLVDLFGKDRLYIELQHHDLPLDDWLTRHLCAVAHEFALPVVATNNVHHAERSGSRLRDALLAIDRVESIASARRAGELPLNSNAYVRTPREMAQQFAERPDALASTVRIAERCQTTIDFTQQRLPHFPVPEGQSEFSYLYELCHDHLPKRYPDLRPTVLKQLAHELEVIEMLGLAGYFLIVWDIVRFAKDAGIRCQGRGSAANSIVAYLLDISSIDPLRHNLLFERFLSHDKFSAPDIDIDFAADRREEVIQYVYARYGHDHAAMVCNIVTYQAKSALRDLAKAMDFPPPVIDRLAKTLDTFSATAAADSLEQMVEENAPAEHPLRLLAGLMREIDGCPRHLSIHSGGMLITGPPLDEVVPLEPATMPGRYICQWDKESVEDAGLIKIDLLGLRMLGCIADVIGQIRQTMDADFPDPDALTLDDPEIYMMLQRADTIGAFQVESRAQQQMLPRLQPATFEDIVIQIAIIRPGPIQGNMVHPYLKRRKGLEDVTYMHPNLEPVLKETLGVLLFQEQVLRVTTVLAGFTPGEADLLRRALSRSRPEQEVEQLRARFVRGAIEKGIDRDNADAVFTQLAGYAGYGFCKSHSASFALIAYHSLWLKRYYPAHFYCALINHQPMGFYFIEVVIGDAKRHAIDLLPPDVRCSAWKFSVERRGKGDFALRTGLCAVKGLGEQAWQRIQMARQAKPLHALQDFCRETRLPKDVVSNLIRSGAMDYLGERRQLLWQLGGLDYRPDEFDLEIPMTSVELPALEPLEQTVWEYELLGMSPSTQVMQHYRTALRQAGILSTWQVKHECQAGQKVRVAGMVVVRQRPGTAKGIMFISLEDESGLLDLVVKPDVYPRVRPVLQATMLIMADGVVQQSEGAVSVLVYGMTALR